MRLKKGQLAPKIDIEDIKNMKFTLENERDKPLLLSFFRYASCPLCNLRIHELITNYDKYSKYFDIVAVFQSPSEAIKKYVGNQNIPFRVVPDPERKLYRMYGVETSWSGFFKAWVVRIVSIFKSIVIKGHLPGSIQGEIHRIPADFLVGTNNHLIITYYGKDIGDHISISEILKELESE